MTIISLVTFILRKCKDKYHWDYYNRHISFWFALQSYVYAESYDEVALLSAIF